MDICLSIGGDNYCYGEQPGWYEINKRVKAQGKKLVLWGCSIGHEDMSNRKLEDLKLFDLILARETLTYQMLKVRVWIMLSYAQMLHLQWKRKSWSYQLDGNLEIQLVLTLAP